jgi:hypothetical protein
VSSKSESILSTPSLVSALIIGEMSLFSSKERRLPSSRYWALVIAWNWLTEFANAFIFSLIEESKGVLWPYLPVLGPCQKGGKLYRSKEGIV